MEKIKPEVIGWEQVEFRGKPCPLKGIIRSKRRISDVSARDFKGSGVKSKFRPVYKKD